ncbi:MAG: serine hydrolase domain-containing protein [Pseudomonas sp.]|uniref:serine hydrolase domain-containing protein n=1 Tax=Pseudomonas sp. TaxID=306 RepID=UPI0027362AC6|nr:serine hydrolase domain-containing protein [Pseudomonas sp.]MDP3847108.1 serine hydrolase domain-containing protein [Pseudomonas sp.]
MLSKQFGCALVLSSLIACGTLSRQQDATATLPTLAAGSDLKAAVDALAQPLIDAGQTPGIVIGVLTADGQRHVYGYGVTEQLGGRPVDGSTLFAIGSLSKGFLADAAALLVQDGSLHWDDTLEQLLPAHTSLSSDAKKITLLQLATHTAGLPRQPMTPQTLSYFVEYLFTGNSFYRHYDRTYLLNYLADFEAPAQVEPQYSNIGYGLLSHVLELHSGQKIDALLQARVLGPLRLDNSSYAPQQLAGFAQRALGHAGDQPKFILRGQPIPDWQFTDILHGTAGLYSTADDLLSYAAAHLQPGANRKLNAALLDTLQVRVERPNEAAAVAWNVDSIGGRKITYQVGFVAGYSSYLGLDTEHQTAVVVLQNSFNWANGAIGHSLLLRLPGAADQSP